LPIKEKRLYKKIEKIRKSKGLEREISMKRQKVLNRFLAFCLIVICMLGFVVQNAEICQARERLIDIEGEFIGRWNDDTEKYETEFNVGAKIEPEYFRVTAAILDTDTYDVDYVDVDPSDITVSPSYMKSERQEVTVKYRYNGTSKTLTFTIKAPEDSKLILKRELLSISAKYEGEPLSVGATIQRTDISVTARFKTTYKTGKVSTIDEELSETDPWTMSSNVIEDGLNHIVITYSYTDTNAEKKKTYKKTATISVDSSTVKGEWIREGNSWRYRYEDGTYLVGAWQQTGFNWYYVDEYGYMITDIMMTLDDATYYFDKEGVMATGWEKYKDKWYYFDSNGAMQKDGWYQIRGDWYYLKESGEMVTGWKYDKGKWYYLDEDGAMMTGWVFDNVTWYYMDTDGAMMENRWIKSNNKWYYLDIGGAMRVNTWVGNYYVDQTGAWTQTKEQ